MTTPKRITTPSLPIHSQMVSVENSRCMPTNANMKTRVKIQPCQLLGDTPIPNRLGPNQGFRMLLYSLKTSCSKCFTSHIIPTYEAEASVKVRLIHRKIH